MHTDGSDRLWNRLFSQLSNLRDVRLGHTSYQHVALMTSTYITNFSPVQKFFGGWTDEGRMYGRADEHW